MLYSKTRVRRGFMLIEVVLAMAVMILVVIAVYQIMQATIMAGEEIRLAKKSSQEMNGLVEMLRRELGGMPNEASVTSSVREGGSAGFSQELIIDGDPLAFSFGASSAHYGPKSVVLIPQIGGLSSIAIEYGEAPDSRNPRPAGYEPPALVLMRDILKVEWLFYDERSASWAEKWEQEKPRPKLVRMLLTRPGESEQYIATFLVPEGGALPASGSVQQPDQEQGPDGGARVTPLPPVQ